VAAHSIAIAVFVVLFGLAVFALSRVRILQFWSKIAAALPEPAEHRDAAAGSSCSTSRREKRLAEGGTPPAATA